MRDSWFGTRRNSWQKRREKMNQAVRIGGDAVTYVEGKIHV